MKKDDGFYVGYMERTAPKVAAQIRCRVIILSATALAFVLAFAASQETLFAKRFEFNEPRSFQGVLQLAPAPHLIVEGPGGGERDRSRFWLVGERKFGAAEELDAFAGQQIRLRGHLLYRRDRTMVEVIAGSVETLPTKSPDAFSGGLSLGRVSLEGEIVDSKCFLGAMNPGRSKVHRACAVLCIEGGIPPALWVYGENADQVILLVDSRGEWVGDRILDLVAEAVQIQGELWRHDDLLVLRSDPETYRRLSR
jgi:hypothetical protein